MPERHEKTFISVHEFVESWDKELYELNNLDFFIYLVINHIGNQLDKRFFTDHRLQSELYLDFEQIGTLCFNLGDTFEFFLEDNCLGACPINCPRDLDSEIDCNSIKLEDRVKRKLEMLQSFLMGSLDKEQCFRLDLMNHVILDSLLQFYSDEFNMEFEENDLSLLEIAEFIENALMEFLRFEGQPLLLKPYDNALEYFEEFLQIESNEDHNRHWTESPSGWQEKSEVAEWERGLQTIEEVFLQFLNNVNYDPKLPGEILTHDINYFSKYLKEYARIDKISELTEQHLAEFLSVWLVREFVMTNIEHISDIFRATARFITFLNHNYHLNLKKPFLKYYETLKTDLPRVIQATNTFISEYNPLDAVFLSDNSDGSQQIGFYEIVSIGERLTHGLEVRNLFEHGSNIQVKFDSSAFNKLRRGDILNATLIRKTNNWELLEVHYIYPNLALAFVG